MPATRSRTSTEQPAEVAAEEVKQVQAEDGAEIVPTEVPVPPTEVVKAAETAVVPETAAAVASEVAAEEQPAVSEPVVAAAAVVADVVTNGSAEPVAAETNGASAEATNGSAVVTNGSVVSESAVSEESVPESAAAEPVSDAKRKSEVGDGDVVPDSTDVKKQKVVQSESEQPAVVADEPVADATA